MVGDWPALAILIEQVGDRLAGTCDVNRASGHRLAGTRDVNRASGRLVTTCDVSRASLVGDWPALAMLIEQVGDRLAGTRDVNRASGRSVGRHSRC